MRISYIELSESIRHRGGFTLIELSIVLVIVGLIIGGILVGRDLIQTAAIRSQIQQLEQYRSAYNTFQGKYGYLPGDIKDPEATSFGFKPRGALAGEGNGDGILLGTTSVYETGFSLLCGETALFWVDLSKAALIPESFNTASSSQYCAGNNDVTSSGIVQYMPEARIGSGNYIYAWSGGPNASIASGFTNSDNRNYFTISGVKMLRPGNLAEAYASPRLTVAQAYAIDLKLDDGLPWAGKINAFYFDATSANYAVTYPANAVTGTAATCYDRMGNAANPYTYSMTSGGAGNMNCALSFRF